MDSPLMVFIPFMILALFSNVQAAAPAGGGAAPAGGGSDITKFGGSPSSADNAKAILDAWAEACKTGGTVVIPKGVFKAGVVTLNGPCQGPVTFNLQGTLQAPATVNEAGWITFEHVDKLTINGGGTLDGQGQEMWKSQPACFKSVTTCKSKAITLRLDFATNAYIEGITSLNSKNFHINVLGGNNITFNKVTITAPAESPNTDGIHIGRAKDVSIIDTTIGTGDDCISVGDGTTNLKVTNVKCGPGHGISVGSLGLYENEAPVDGITVTGCTLTGTDNGVRFKSWPDKFPATASNINFAGITMNNVKNPVIIDQAYCPYSKCSTGSPKVKLTGVSFKDIKGTTPTPEAISLFCMPGMCTNIELANIDLKLSGGTGPAKANCTNIKPTVTGTVNPAGC